MNNNLISPMLPDFIIIGGMKCGTSSLYHYLSLHPGLGMSDIKEVDYFIAENNFDKGVEWYKSRFQGDALKYGEASPNYSKAHFFKDVPRRMYELLPKVRLIYLVRDPIERIISHYTHNIGDGREQRNIEEALKEFDGNHYVMCSRYYWQLNHYLKYFTEDQILVAKSSDLMHHRKHTLQEIFKFLDVDDSFYTPAFEQEKHKTGKKRKRGKTARLLLESPIIKTVKGFIPDSVKNPLKKMTRPVVEKPDVKPPLKEKLSDYFRRDVDALETFTGKSFNEWDI